MKTLAVSSSIATLSSQAQQLAAQLNLPWVESIDPSYDYVLIVAPEFLGLQNTREKRFSPFHIDFLAGRLLYRSQQAGLRKELIGRAMGCHPKDKPTIIDATAGLGRDSFILATLGFNVIALERSPILYALLKDALGRAQKQPSIAPIIERIHLIHADAHRWLIDKKADVIYLDPMFPERQKSASVKKEMVILQELLGKDEDAEALFKLALTCATHRVVVKRPRLSAAIDARAPHFSLSGKSSRFDIYLTK